MKIAIFTETYLPCINGVVTHIKTLKDGLEALGHEVLIVTADSKVKNHVISNGVMYCPAVRLKKIYNYDVSSPLSTERMQLLRDFNPDIVHIHNEFGIGISGIRLAKKMKIPLVYTLHTMYDDYVYYVAKKPFRPIVTGASHSYAKALAQVADAITGPSNKVVEYFNRIGIKRPIYVIPNAVELDTFDPDKMNADITKRIRNSFGFEKNDIIFCFCGRLGKEKNISLLLKYWAEKVKPDENLKLVIFGGGPLYDELVSETRSLGISEMVHFTNAVDHNKMPYFLAACDCYITASLSDTCSISMLEAMAMGLPVIHISDEMNAGQVVDGENGFIYHDQHEMYECLLKIKNMPEDELKALMGRARRFVIESGATRLAGDVLKVYEETLKNFSPDKEKQPSRRFNRPRS